jgi:hypothetical protein
MSSKVHWPGVSEFPLLGSGGLVGFLLGLPVEAGGGDVLVVEVDRGEVSGDLVLAAPEPGEVAARAQVTLEEALARLKPSLQKVAGLLRELSPDQTVVEFGLKVGGETGMIIAKGTAEVNFKVTMSWGREQRRDQEP